MLLSYIAAAIAAFLIEELRILALSFRIRLIASGLSKLGGDELLDRIEEDLQQVSDRLDLPYIRPHLSPDGARLLARSPTRFVKRYVLEVRRACISSANFISL